MSDHRPSIVRLAATLTAAAIAVSTVAIAPAVAARDPFPWRDALTITHPAVQTTLTTVGSDGHQLGDLRVASIPVALEGSDQVGQLDTTLTTVGIDQPEPGDEVRIGVLVFSFADHADQVVVMGSAVYPRAGSTLATDTTVVRPIVGGAGAFAGVTGWAESEHLADGSWRHTLTFTRSMFRGMPVRPMLDRTGRRGDLRGHRGWWRDATPAPVASPSPAA